MPGRRFPFLLLFALLLSFVPTEGRAQAPATPPAGSSSSSKSAQQKHSHANDFVFRGTVFTDKSLAFPGAQLRIRRAGETKFRWQDHANSRGEFAIRVPQGSQYEIVVRAKGFADQARTVDAQGNGSDNLVFRMQPVSGAKK